MKPGVNKNTISDVISSFWSRVIIMLPALYLIRIWELFSGHLSTLLHVKKGLYIFNALFIDTVFFFFVSAVLFVLYSILYAFSRRSANITLSTLSIIIVVGQAMLVSYFLTALNPLGADLYHYTIDEVKLTAGAALTTKTIILMLALLLVVIVVFVLAPLYLKLKKRLALLLLCIAVAVSSIWGISPAINKSGGSEFLDNLKINKSAYFYKQSFYYFTGWQEKSELPLFADAFVGSNTWLKKKRLANQFDYIDPGNYPFLHTVDSASTIGPYLKQSDRNPDVVIVIVEGLGRAFSGKDAYLGSFTPFLDSLANKSLYWENCLSAGGRTFAVLPSVLGSLPFGDNGFAELGEKMPGHLGLINILQANGYYSRFIYAGNSGFDNMNQFMQLQHTDEVLDEKDFGNEFARLPGNASGFSWGYGDFELYQRYFRAFDKKKDIPSVNVLLTISTHSPFLVPNQEKYSAGFKQRLGYLNTEEREKELCRENHQQLETVLYMDDAIRNFFEEYRKRESFENTIFVITGDHRMPDIPMSTKIDRYHVPLIIYSPLLKRSSRFSTVVSHLDITPELLGFLSSSYKLKVPYLACWMGTGLDTTAYFSNKSEYPLMQTKNGISEMISGNSLISQENLFTVKDKMLLEADNNVAQKEKLKNALANQIRFHHKLVENQAMYPDSLLQKFNEK